MKRLLLLGLLFSSFAATQATGANALLERFKRNQPHEKQLSTTFKNLKKVTFSQDEKTKEKNATSFYLSVFTVTETKNITSLKYELISEEHSCFGFKRNTISETITGHEKCREFLDSLKFEEVHTSYWKPMLGLCALAGTGYYFYKNPENFEVVKNWTCEKTQNLFTFAKAKLFG